MHLTKVISGVVLAAGTLCLLAADPPKLLPFQGQLTDQNGAPIGDGERVVQFKIYDAPVGGQAVWNGEVQKLTVNRGLVNTMLGSKASLSAVDFNHSLYLELTVDANSDGQITAADPPLLPRQSLQPTVFAKEAADSRRLGGYNWSDLLGSPNPQNGIPGSRIHPQSVTAAQLAPQSITASHIAPETITGGQIAAATLTSNHFAPGGVDLSALADVILQRLNPSGAIIAFGGDANRIPEGWLLCNGRAVSSTVYPQLYAAIGTSWGAGISDGANNFNLPDLRGLFLRGVNGTRTGDFADPESANRANSVPVGTADTGNLVTGNSGNKVGSLQIDELKSHNHRLRSSSVVAWLGASRGLVGGSTDQGNYINSGPGMPFVEATGGSETRPVNAYVHYIIKY